MTEERERLMAICRQVRSDIVSMIGKAGSGHPGGSLSATELVCGLYFGGILKYRPEDPEWEGRDRFILSKGHAGPLLYSVLARAGFYSPDEMQHLRELGSILQGHPHAERIPGFECSAGSLGQGLSVANGLAFAFRRTGHPGRVYCLMGDGELQEGSVWEAVMTAAQHHLDNVCALVDYNHVQLDDTVENIKALGDLCEKFTDFGWNAIEVDGHDVINVVEAYKIAEALKGAPTVIIANTVKGKGVSYMEGDPAWHGTAPNAEQLERALSDIAGGNGFEKYLEEDYDSEEEAPEGEVSPL
ncbi:MAG: transketolase [Lachnospiraceae bacterium]|nr:transketolase [Lachnospiraceae bacterium]